MRIGWLLLTTLCVWAGSCTGSPLPTAAAPAVAPVEGKAVETSRQAEQPAQPVAAAPTDDEDDDDDDDDDDDVDLDLGDDDDDDEEDDDTAADDDDDDDDDDEDYFERFFDDILGDDDDDDDEEEEDDAPTSAVVAAAPAAAPAQASSPQAIQGLAASNVDYNGDYGSAAGEDEPLETGATQTQTVVLNSSSQSDAAAAAAADDADADDDDDDDDDDDEDDEDDDDDDDILETKRSRSIDEADMAPPAYIKKYNKFVDSILERVNKILRRSYDPVNVRLQTVYETKKASTKKKKKNKNKNKSSSNSEERKSEVNKASDTSNLVSESSEPTFLEPVSNMSAEPAEPRKKKPTKSNTTPAPPKVNKKTKSPTLRARATLYGLSSIQRDGDVTVNVMSSHTTVKTKFLVGPLVLKVEKEFGRGAKKELRSATATTAEMIGKLNLRVVNGGAATLHSIKVLQPRQVRVESPDDHDRTREFVWKKSSTIAHLVSEKLLAATKSMLQPPPAGTTNKPVVTLPATPA